MNRSKILFRSSMGLQAIIMILLAVVALLLGIYIEQTKEEGSYPIYPVAVLWVLLLVLFLWAGNVLLNKVARVWLSRRLAPDGIFVVQLLLTLIFSIAYINITYLIFKNRYTALPPTPDQVLLLNIYGVLFLVPVLSIQFGILFLRKWKKANLERERLKKEQVQSELIALKSHLSPHFLFNNLNILSSLISVDNVIAQDFLDGFAEVYRYVLKHRETELVSLREELDFIRSYVFLLEQRFRKELNVTIDVAHEFLEFRIPPLALQMLLENAIKHNKMSEEQPLTIKIKSLENSELSIENDLRPRDVPAYEKTGTGLENIRRRYQLITNHNITIGTENGLFSVLLPLIRPAQK